MCLPYSQTKLVLDGLLDLLACEKCKRTPERPMRNVNCGHFFCYACMYEETECFKCKIPLSPHDIRPCRIVGQLIDYHQIVNNAITEINYEDLKPLSRAIRTFIAKSNGIVPETDSESEGEIVESTPPGQNSSQKNNAKLANSFSLPISPGQHSSQKNNDELANMLCTVSRRLSMNLDSVKFPPKDKEPGDSKQLHSQRGNEDSDPKTTERTNASQLCLQQAKQNFQLESAGYVSHTQFSPQKKKRNSTLETAGFAVPPETAGFVSPTQFSPHQRKYISELETAGFVSPTQFSPQERRRNVPPETAGFISPTQFSQHQRRRNVPPESAGFVSPTQFNQHETRQNVPLETANRDGHTQISLHDKKLNFELETAGFISPTQLTSHIRTQNFQPETAGFVDPTQFTAIREMPNVESNMDLKGDHKQLNKSHWKSNSEQETVEYVAGMQTPPSHKKKHSCTNACKFLCLRTRRRCKTSISEKIGSYIEPTPREVVGHSRPNQANQLFYENSSITDHSRFVNSVSDSIDKSTSAQSNSILDTKTSATNVNFVNAPKKLGEIKAHSGTVGLHVPTEIPMYPTNAKFPETSEIFDFTSTDQGHKQIVVEVKTPSSDRVDDEENNERMQNSSIIQKFKTDLALAPEPVDVHDDTFGKVVIPESVENIEEAPNRQNALAINNDCVEKSMPTKSSSIEIPLDKSRSKIDQDTTSDVSETKIMAIQKETPLEKLKCIKNLALKRLSKIRKISQDFTKPVEHVDTRNEESREKRKTEEDPLEDSCGKNSFNETNPTSVTGTPAFGDEMGRFVERAAKRLKRTKNLPSEEPILVNRCCNPNSAKLKDSYATTVEVEEYMASTDDPREKDNDSETSVDVPESELYVVNDLTRSPGTIEKHGSVQHLRSFENLDGTMSEIKYGKIEARKDEEAIMALEPREICTSRTAGSKNLLKHITKRNAKGETPLHTACVKGQRDYVKVLLKRGANPNTKDNANWTPLQEAVSLGHREICMMLLRAGASVNTPAMDNRTALHEASANNRLEEAALLLRYNANKNVYDKFGKKPIEYAVSEEMRALLNGETKIDAIINNDLHVESTFDQSIIIPNAKVIVLPSNLSNPNRKLLAQLASKIKVEVATTFRSTVTHLVVETNDRNITELTYDVMLGILQGKWILNSQWITVSKDVDNISDIDLELFEVRGVPNPETPARARLNEEKQNPRLFNNCFFYFAIGSRCTWSYEKFEFTKESLTALVLRGQGEILNREPDPEDVKDYQLTPFHVAHMPMHTLYRCSHYIIFMPGKDEPRVKYNMPHIKSLPIGWFLECIEKFTLIDPVLMGIA